MLSIFMETQRFSKTVERLYAQALANLRLTPVEAHVIALLSEEGALRPTDLAMRISVRPTGFTSVLDGLETHGFIVRSDNPVDRRSVIVRLTPAGEDLAPLISGVLAKAHDTVIATLEDEHSALSKFIEKYAPLSLVGKPY